MEQIRLGRTGLQVSRLGLGTMTFGREIGEAESHRLMDRFTEAGGTLIDTADAYGEGRSEEIVGSWLKGRPRQDVVIASKVRFGSGPNHRGLSRKHLLDAIDGGTPPTGADTRIAVTNRAGEPVWTEAWANYDNDRTWNVVETLAAVADEIGRTPAQIALNWLMNRPGVTAPIVGARTMRQLDENLGAVDATLQPEQRDRLTRASETPKPYPYQLLADLRDA